MYLPIISGLKTFDDAAFGVDLDFISRTVGTYFSSSVNVGDFAEYLAILLFDVSASGGLVWTAQESNDDATFTDIPNSAINSNDSPPTSVSRKLIYFNFIGPKRGKFIRLKAVLSGATSVFGALSLRMSPLGGKIVRPNGSVWVI